MSVSVDRSLITSGFCERKTCTRFMTPFPGVAQSYFAWIKNTASIRAVLRSAAVRGEALFGDLMDSGDYNIKLFCGHVGFITGLAASIKSSSSSARGRSVRFFRKRVVIGRKNADLLQIPGFQMREGEFHLPIEENCEQKSFPKRGTLTLRLSSHRG